MASNYFNTFQSRIHGVYAPMTCLKSWDIPIQPTYFVLSFTNLLAILIIVKFENVTSSIYRLALIIILMANVAGYIAIALYFYCISEVTIICLITLINVSNFFCYYIFAIGGPEKFM